MSISETVIASEQGPSIELGMMEQPDAQPGAERPVVTEDFLNQNGAPGTNFEPEPLQRTATHRLTRIWRAAIFKPEFKDLAKRVAADRGPEPLRTAVENVLEYLRRKKDVQGQRLNGYPQFAAFLATDERWMMCRRFSALQARLVLEKQDEMREVEEELLAFDQADSRRPELGEDPEAPRRLASRRRRNSREQAERQELIDRVERKFKEYAALISAVRAMTCCEKPAGYEYRNVKRFAEEVKPSPASELEWILFRRDDIITLRGAREHAYIGAFIEYAYNLYKHTNEIGLTEWATQNRASEKWTGHSISVLLLLLVPLMFVVPIYALSRIGNSIGKSIAVLLSFALVFTLILRAVTSARPHEVLGTSAAYLAVLVVFFGSVGRSQGVDTHG